MQTPTMLSPVLVNETAEGCKEFEYPLDRHLKSVIVTGAIRVIYEESEKTSIRLQTDQELDDRLALSDKDGELTVHYESDVNQPFPGTLYIYNKGMTFLSSEGEADVHLKGQVPMSLMEVHDRAKVDLSESSFVQGSSVHLYVSSQIPFFAGNLDIETLHLQVAETSKVELASLQCSDVYIFQDGHSSITLSGEADYAFFSAGGESRLDASAFSPKRLECSVRQEGTVVCCSPDIHVFEAPNAGFRNLDPKAVVKPFGDDIQKVRVRLLPKDEVCKIVTHIKESDAERKHTMFIIPEYDAERKSFQRQLAANRFSDCYPDFVLFGVGAFLTNVLFRNSITLSESFESILEDFVIGTYKLPALLPVIVDEDDIDWEEIPESKECFESSPVLEYTQDEITD